MAASYGNTEVSAYLASGTNTDGFATTGDVVANNILADGGLSSSGPSFYQDDVTMLANASIGLDLSIGGNTDMVGNLNVNGRTSLGFVSNVAIAGGSPSDVLSTDSFGGLFWAAPYTDADVTLYLGSGAPFNISTSGNISADRATTASLTTTNLTIVGGNTNLGPVSTIYIPGGSPGQLLTKTTGPGPLAWTDGYTNASVSTYLASNTNTGGFATQGAISSVGNITSAGNLNLTGNILANRIQAPFITATNTAAAGFLVATVSTTTPNISVSGNVTTANVTASNRITTANLTASNLISSNTLVVFQQASVTNLVVGSRSEFGAVGNVSITGGANGQVLTTNGDGALSWAAVPGPTYRGIVSGTLTAGAPVVSTDGGKLSSVISVTQGIGPSNTFNGDRIDMPTVVTIAPLGFVAAFYPNRSANMLGQVTIGSINSLTGAMTWGPNAAFAGTVSPVLGLGAGGIGGAWDSVNQKLIVAYRDQSNGNRGTVKVGTIDFGAKTVAWGSPVVFSNTAVIWCSAAYDPVSGKVAISYDTNGATCIMGTVTGTSMTFGTPTTIEAGGVGYTSTVYDSVNNRIVVSYTKVVASDYRGPVKSAAGTVSGTSISFGSPTQITGDDNYYFVTSTFDPINNRVVVSYTLFITSNGNYGYIKAFRVVGSSIGSVGSQVTIQGPFYLSGTPCWDQVSGKILMFYGYVEGTASNQRCRVTLYDLVDSTLTGTSVVNIYNASPGFTGAASSDNGGWFTVVMGPSNTATSVAYRAPFNNLTANNFIGFSSANYANAQTATVNIVGSVIANQSGLIPGRKYYVQPSGTLSQTAGTPNVYAGQSVTSTELIVKG
jgi:hypothetical protein